MYAIRVADKTKNEIISRTQNALENLVMSIIEKLQELKMLLSTEYFLWIDRKENITMRKISKYLSAISVLEDYAVKNQYTHFALTFKHFGITAKGVRNCFHGTDNVAQKRDLAEKLFKNICDKVVENLRPK